MPQNIFKIYGGANSFWQWETDQKLIVLDETIDKVHFSNKYMRRAFTREVYVDTDGLRVCNIPDEMFTIPKNLIATAHDNEGAPDSIIRSVQFAVKARPIPYDYKDEQGNQASGIMQFNTLFAAEKWALDTQKAGAIIAVNINSVWTACIVGEDYGVNAVWDQEYVLDAIDNLNYLVGDAKVQTVIENHNLETRKYVDKAISNIEIPSIDGLATEQFVTNAIAAIPEVDLTNYATKDELPSVAGLASEIYVDRAVSNLINSAPETLDTIGEIAKALQDHKEVSDALNEAIGKKADKSDIPSLEGYATEEYVNEALSGFEENGISYVAKDTAPEDTDVLWVDTSDNAMENIALTGYATEEWVQEGYQPKGEYLTEVPDGYATKDFVSNKIDEVDLSSYALKTEIPSVPVQSVNGKTGAVNLSAADVGAIVTVNGMAPDEDGNVEIESGASCSVTVDEETMMVSSGGTDSGDNLDVAIGRNFANWGMPVLYLSGDTTDMTKDNAVDLAYAYSGHTGTASVKWQGSSAVDLGKAYGKFNYTIKFDTAFEVKEGWGVRKKYCLKANWIDASHARNLLSAKLWGQMCSARSNPDSALADCPNWGAVDGFPCIIAMNGEFLGLFTWNVPKDEWMMNMPHDGAMQECIICAEEGDPAMFKALATLDGSDFEIEYITDKDDTEWAVESINRAISACLNSDGSDIDTVIAQYIDIDSAIDYLIFCAVTANMDGMDRNYLLSTTDGVKWRFTAYDMDTTFGLYWAGKGFTTADDYPFPSNFANVHRLMYLLYNYKADAVKARYKELRAKVLSEIRIAYEALNFAAKIPKVALNAEAEKWPLIPSSGINTVYQIIEYLRMRFLRLDAHVEAMVQQDPIPAPMMLKQHGWFDDNAATIGQAEVTKVSFVPSYTATGTEDASWACDVNKTGTIMAYQNGTEVTVAPTNGASKILVNKDSTFMFAVRGAGNEAYGNFASLATVTGTEMFVAQAGTNMQEICNGNNVLTSKIYVPDGVVNIKKAFSDCTALTETPVLPDSVTQMDNALFKCSGLTKLPNIPASAVSMQYTFQDCYGITDVNGVVIPESVTNMIATFFNLRNASGVIEINAQNLTAYDNAFMNAAADANQITLTGSCPLLAELAATNTAGKVVVAA